VMDCVDESENDVPTSVWLFESIISHQGPLRQSDPDYAGSSWNVKVQRQNGEVTTEPLSITARDDPVLCTIYARDHGLLNFPGWQRFTSLVRVKKKFLRLVNQAKLHSYRTAPKYQYGYEVPRNTQHAIEIDTKNGNANWKGGTALEMSQLKEYQTFKDYWHDQLPDGYQKIREHLVYAVKHDGRLNARLVANGNLTDIPVESVYSGIVSLRGLQLIVFFSELNELETWATDIGNAYLETETKEKVYIVAGPEFGELEGYVHVVHKTLCGLRTRGKRWSERLADCLREMGFEQCKAEPDIWIRRNGNVYEYIGTYVHDMCPASTDPMDITQMLEEDYNFKHKGTGPIAFHLGCDFERDEDGTMCKEYIEKMVDSYQRMFGEMPSSKVRSPLEKGAHPELKTSVFLDSDGIQIYQSLIGAMRWAVSLARFDIATAVMTLSSFRVAPRFGHLDYVKRIYGYLSLFKDASLRIRTDEPNYSSIPDQEHDWMYTVYGNVMEIVPTDASTPLGKTARTMHYVDANSFHDMVAERSVTGILDFVNQAPIVRYNKKQATVENATYGSEFVVAGTCAERDIDLWTLLQSVLFWRSGTIDLVKDEVHVYSLHIVSVWNTTRSWGVSNLIRIWSHEYDIC
jgi:hypothetical protein